MEERDHQILNEKVKVLLVEDNPLDAELVEFSLIEDFSQVHVHRVDNYKDLHQGLHEFDPDLVISDYSMPGFSGKEALMLCSEIKPECPFIFVSGTIGEERAVEALKNGAVDYVLKSSLARLPHAAYMAMKNRKERLEKKEKQHELNETHDLLNSVFNTMHMMVAYIDKAYTIIKVNRAFSDLYGQPPHYFVGKRISDFFESNKNFRSIFKRVLETKMSYFSTSDSFVLKDQKSHSIFLDWSVAATNDAGKSEGLVITAIDVTERCKAEKERDELLEDLEIKVQQRTSELRSAYADLKSKNEDIHDSISYARHIQEAFIPPLEPEKIKISNSFAINIPKDTLSGDFHWQKYIKSENKTFLAIGDCTGHGVPGSLMTMLAIQFFEKEIAEADHIYSVDQILHRVDRLIVNFLGQKNKDNMVKDGMEVVLVCIDHTKGELSFSSAGRPFYFVSDKDGFQKFSAPKYAVGGLAIGRKKEFEKVEISYQKGDRFYACSDGYTDQFGGERNKKFGTKRLWEVLEAFSKEPFVYQEKLFFKTFKKWQGKNEQIDDVIFVGVKL